MTEAINLLKSQLNFLKTESIRINGELIESINQQNNLEKLLDNVILKIGEIENAIYTLEMEKFNAESED